MIPSLSEALAERGFDTLTDVQKAVTAPELAGADLLVSAQTGSGKTVGFGLAIAPTLMGEENRMGPPAAPLALVVAPTRELALQVQRELVWLYARTGAKVVSCIGGMDARDERRALDRGAHIVVGTPGRLRDHITRGALDLSDIRAVVLDEADEMLDLGFREDLEFMLGAAPAGRRTLLFSATVPPAIAELAKAYQRDAVRVTTLSRGSQHADIAYKAVQVTAADAEHAIINLLRFHDAPTAIVFANTRAAVSRLAARFANRGLSAVSLSGELSQDERSHALQAMRDGRARVCVATDVAARGIDLPNLDLVIHADLPSNTEALLHRSGRTGRAGRKGISALIVPDKLAKKAGRLLKWAKIEAEWILAPTPEEILALDETRLLADPIWEAAPSEAEAAFAARLLAERSPDLVAAACLRLYRAGLSAPEELNAPAAPGARPERPPFGPSVWFELSVGRDRRAEPRWLLPLVCRAGNLERSQIGRIQLRAETSLVEIAEAAVPGFVAGIGPDGLLEEDITARRFDGPVEDTRGSRPKSDRPKADRSKSDRPRSDRSRPDTRPDRAPRPPRPAPAEAATGASTGTAAPSGRPDAPPPRGDAAEAPRPKPEFEARPTPSPTPGPERRKVLSAEAEAPKPRAPRREADAAPAERPRKPRPGPERSGPRSEAGGPRPKEGRKDGWKDARKDDRKDGRKDSRKDDRKDGRKDGWKDGPARGPKTGPKGGSRDWPKDKRPAGNDAAPAERRRADAADTSKRFERPGAPKGKGAKPTGGGKRGAPKSGRSSGNAPPRRPR
ncbi:ATP-dependent RNA helicase DeaD [Rhodovulum sulfidophilum]|uniref:DEAD/DEAH box helicase n=1 Tax=Rhodovulum sulfidophilum TaxID=35806 RepID=UPI0005A94592|nr:DEAD/DEAH box helicase [Rhodovulum sulfidophilum]ANB33369.1 DEAD/DEAH box helicase [Rhodovulum sulfidophilum DSM 1374]ANB37190.1 DEAD/DEAH box helicase [Rhodovulum sulfidophilum]MCW2304401.1 ATP-dependent RNA helicase DeaD [Rhodovulum sulfidophilum]